MIKVLPPKTADEVVSREKERKARTTLLMALHEDHLEKFHKMVDAKEMWEAIKSRFGGNDESMKMQKYLLKQQLKIHGAGVSHRDANQKFLRSLPSSWSQVALIMRTKPGLDTLSFDDLYNNLRVFERDVKEIAKLKGIKTNRRRDGRYNANKARDNGRRPAYQDDSKALVTMDGENINWSGYVEEDTQNYVMMAYSSSNSGFDNESVFMNKDCDLEDTHVNDRYAEGMHVVPPSMIGNYMPSRPDVEIDYSKFTYGPKQTSVDDSDAKPMWTDAPIIEEYESDSDNDLVSNVQEDKETPSFAFTDFVKHVKTLRENVKETSTPNHCPKIKKQGRNGYTRKDLGILLLRPQQVVIGETKEIQGTKSLNTTVDQRLAKDDPYKALKDKGIVDSGCSRHMTGNKAHLVDYQEFKGGSVAFGGSNGRIIGKGKIKDG
nr:xylulose kinase-1 [Tanacetum cinerariifolium]